MTKEIQGGRGAGGHKVTEVRTLWVRVGGGGGGGGRDTHRSGMFPYTPLLPL